MTPQIVHRGNEVFPAFCGHMDIGNVSSMSWEGVTCIACLAELPQPQWHVFNKTTKAPGRKKSAIAGSSLRASPSHRCKAGTRTTLDPNAVGIRTELNTFVFGCL